MQSCSGCDQAEAHELTRGQTHAHAHARTKALRHVQAMSPFIPHATLSLAVSCDQELAANTLAVISRKENFA